MNKQLHKYSIFLIRDIKTDKKRLDSSLSKYSFRIFEINHEKYFCFLAKKPYSINRIASEFNVNVSQVKGTQYVNTKTIPKYDDKTFVYFYIWSIPDPIFKVFTKIVNVLNNKGQYDFNNWYYKIICEEHISRSLIPLFELFGTKISYKLGLVPVLSMYGGKLEDEFSKEQFSTKINELAGPETGITRIMQLPFWHNSHAMYIVEFSSIEKCNQCYHKVNKHFNTRQTLDENVLDNLEKYKITITEINDETASNIGEYIKGIGDTYNITRRKDKERGEGFYQSNVIYNNPENVFNNLENVSKLEHLNWYFTNTAIDLFNLPPNITEEQIMQSFTCQTKPVSIEINNIGQQQCWSARLQFNNKSIDDVQNAMKFIDDKKLNNIGVLIPFGFICNKSRNYRLRKDLRVKIQ